MKKVRSRQAAIFVINWVKHDFYLWVSLALIFSGNDDMFILAFPVTLPFLIETAKTRISQVLK